MPRHKIIREQIEQMSPLTVDELESAPENTNTVPSSDESIGPQRGPNGRLLKKDGSERKSNAKRARTDSVDQSDLMADPRYRKAIQGMSFFGAPRVIKRSFSVAADISKDASFALNEEEQSYVEDYFYAVSKHTAFDPMGSLMGRLILFVLLMGELILPRLLKNSKIAEQLKEMILNAQKKEPEEPTVQ
jgi:hypothetical protein